eukprot:15441126-Alexandrium_andersonii.AAC.1
MLDALGGRSTGTEVTDAPPFRFQSRRHVCLQHAPCFDRPHEEEQVIREAGHHSEAEGHVNAGPGNSLACLSMWAPGGHR